MKKLPILNLLLIIVLFVFVVFSSYQNSNSREVYIVTGELFQNFDYQNELNAEYIKLKDTKDKEIENYITLLKKLQQKIKEEQNSDQAIYDYQVGLERLQKLQNDVNDELSKISAEYNDKIWDKLNRYVTEYGKENNYKVIFGAGGDGNIMYAEESINVTSEVVEYCNNKYNGK